MIRRAWGIIEISSTSERNMNGRSARSSEASPCSCGSVSLLNPLRYHLFAWQLFSHKLCRWLVPFAMIAALVANGYLALSSSVYRAILLVQACFYSLALVYMLSRRVPSIGMLRIPSFFVMVNLSILDAWMRYFLGERIVSWNPSKR